MHPSIANRFWWRMYNVQCTWYEFTHHAHTHMHIYAYATKKELPFRTFPVNLSRAKIICIEWNHLCGYECKCISDTNFYLKWKIWKQRMPNAKAYPNQNYFAFLNMVMPFQTHQKYETRKTSIAEWKFSHFKNAHTISNESW